MSHSDSMRIGGRDSSGAGLVILFAALLGGAAIYYTIRSKRAPKPRVYRVRKPGSFARQALLDDYPIATEGEGFLYETLQIERPPAAEPIIVKRGDEENGFVVMPRPPDDPGPDDPGSDGFGVDETDFKTKTKNGGGA